MSDAPVIEIKDLVRRFGPTHPHEGQNLTQSTRRC
jgi:hypothetical protein